MKTPEEIRRLRNALLVGINAPCGCGGTEHEYQCVQGGMMMQCIAVNLSWVLGENDGLQAHVEEVIRRADAITGSN